MSTSPTHGPAVATALGSFFLWGMLPLLFMGMNTAGFSATEIVAHRTLWSVFVAGIIVIAARQLPELRAVLTRPSSLAWLGLSALMIFCNWSIYVYATTHGATLEVSLGYYLNPLLNMAAGALLFRERLSRIGLAAVALAGIGVVIQGLALGRFPYLGLAVALTFCAYAVIRKRITVSAQTGLFVEAMFLMPIGIVLLSWLATQGPLTGLQDVPHLLIAMVNGPTTVIPLVMFAWAARRLPLMTVGFMQFLAPTLQFACGLWFGEELTPLRLISFAFIWVGAGVFILAMWLKTRSAKVA